MQDLMRLVRSWLNGSYRVFPWRTLFVLILLAIYAINPFDIIPDFIPIIGVIDDAAMLGFLVRSVMKDVQKFKEWERLNVQGQRSRNVQDAEFVEVNDETQKPKDQLLNPKR